MWLIQMDQRKEFAIETHLWIVCIGRIRQLDFVFMTSTWILELWLASGCSQSQNVYTDVSMVWHLVNSHLDLSQTETDNSRLIIHQAGYRSIVLSREIQFS